MGSEPQEQSGGTPWLSDQSALGRGGRRRQEEEGKRKEGLKEARGWGQGVGGGSLWKSLRKGW